MKRRHSDEYYENFRIHYGAVVRELRIKAGMTRETFAKKSRISVSTVCIIEQGKGNPLLETMDSIAKTLKTSIGRMFKLADERGEK